MRIPLTLNQSIIIVSVLFFLSFTWTVFELLNISPMEQLSPPTQGIVGRKEEIQVPTIEDNMGTFQLSLKKYIEYHNQALSQKDLSALKFIVYVENNGGIGNHFLPMVSTLAYAMLTNRIYLQHKVKVSGALMSSMFTSDFQTLELSDVAKKLGKSPDEILRDSGMTKKITIRHKFTQLDWDYLYCGNILEESLQFIEIFSNQYYLPTVVHNSHIRNRVLELFGTNYFAGGVDVYGELVRVLFKPLPYVQDLVDDFVRDNFAKYTIGVQLRKEFLEFKNWDVLWLNAVRKVRSLYLLNQPEASSDTVVFLASDYNISKIKESWAGERVVFIDKIPGRSKEAQIYAVLDILLLSRANDLIITEHSTFGSSAAGFGSVLPYAMTRQGMCRRYLSSQPHCHFCEFVKKLSCFNPSTWYSLDNTIEG